MDPGRRRLWRRHRTSLGASPGTLAPAPDAATTSIRLICYGPEHCEVTETATVAQVAEALARGRIVWVDVNGLADLAIVEALGQMFHLDRLALEDVMTGMSRPKLETGEHNDFVVAKIIHSESRFDAEQVSLFYAANYVVSFHERGSAYLEPVRERITRNRGKIRRVAGDYLAYAILDCLVDHYFPTLGRFAESMAELDEQLFHANARDSLVPEIREIRATLVRFHGIAMPLLETVTRMVANPSGRIAAATRPYLKDCQDHVLQIIDQIESLRQSSSDLMNQYNTLMTLKLNATMQVLTIIATIFIPLTFITSVYGMNFDTSMPWNMPELRHPYGYLGVMGFMVLLTLAMLAWFNVKGWIRLGRRHRRTAVTAPVALGQESGNGHSVSNERAIGAK